ncbi:MAG: helix-turn-helix transcriptional regulator [Myxococcota bacterium]
MDERTAALVELRTILAEIRASGARTVPAVRLAAVRQRLGVQGVHVDFDAAEALGTPLVVVSVAPGPAPCLATLTPREREVAELVATGLRNQDIALALGIGLATVKDHVHHILTKSGLDGRAAIAAAWRGA